jgi:hypothetical protein
MMIPLNKEINKIRREEREEGRGGREKEEGERGREEIYHRH